MREAHRHRIYQLCMTLLALTTRHVTGYSNGAPTFVCETMVPGHGVGPQTSTAPYTVTAQHAANEAGKVHVTVYSPTQDDFTGFLVQARPDPNNTRVIGSFSAVPDNSKTIDCSGFKGSAATQKSNSAKRSVELEWEAPPGYDGPVTFMTTVVKNKNTFWVGMESPSIQVKRFADGDLSIPSVSSSDSSFLDHIFKAEKDIYKGCGRTKNCFGIPAGCIEVKNCTAVVSVVPSGNKYQFDMLAKRSEYVAVGLSDDEKMGDDNVIECLHDPGRSAVQAYRSWNLPTKKNRREEEHNGFSLQDGYYADGYIYCRFTHDPQFMMHDIKFDLDRSPYYLLLASGSKVEPNGVGFHNIAFATSPDKKRLSDLKSVKKDDPFYKDCNSLKNCFGFPDGCVDDQSCQAVVSVLVQGQRYEFELKGETTSYIAVGLSQDQKMGGDSVMECVYDPNTPSNVVKLFMSWNIPNDKKNTRARVQQSAVNLLSSSYEDGELYCKFTRDVRTTIEGTTFDLANNKYFLLLAAGSGASSEGVGYHDRFTAVSGQQRSLADVGAFTGASKLYLHLHGSFMVAAWIGFASLGIVLARYFKQTWVGKSHCGTDIWFTYHRMFMILVWLLTIAGLVLIFLEVGEWVAGPSQTHAILGCITSALCFIQPFMAAFRPHPNALRRPLFNWMHWFVGNAAHIVGIVTIFFAGQLSKAMLPGWMDWILVGYVAFYVCIHLILSISGCMSERQGAKRVNAFPMKDIVGRGAINNMERKRDNPYSGFRKFLLFIHVIVVVGVSAVLIILIVFAPIEDQVKSLKDKIMNF
ncbi:putative ferric-chelate reductase 1 homolog isoform X1 [Nilaparvata lugens]|uniref:putative ferric-chelate reductase 1 homolog isoform X1 n=1 Tax=Nilaparvata lugens TaxID=108931 RepID=UPI00193E61FF|nr:putative ferric-chelate reductase 1 homolog isoform X1 [Nilaparvata lugens]